MVTILKYKRPLIAILLPASQVGHAADFILVSQDAPPAKSKTRKPKVNDLDLNGLQSIQ